MSQELASHYLSFLPPDHPIRGQEKDPLSSCLRDLCSLIGQSGQMLEGTFLSGVQWRLCVWSGAEVRSGLGGVQPTPALL